MPPFLRPPFVRALRVLGLLALACLLLLVGAYAYIHGGGNFHEVEKGTIYRSSRLGADGLDKAVDRYGVKSVLNLCGEQPGTAWYDGEVAVSRLRGVRFINLVYSANVALESAQVTELVETLRDAPKPLLIHCRAGSDRTGLACALYVADHGGTYQDAQGQLSLYYGHFPYLGSRSVAMDLTLARFFERVAGVRLSSRSGP